VFSCEAFGDDDVRGHNVTIAKKRKQVKAKNGEKCLKEIQVLVIYKHT
jgi:hypothetical protein